MVSRGKPFRKGGSGGPAAPPSGAGSGAWWGCGKCGVEGNWPTRDRCRACGARSPEKIEFAVRKAKADLKHPAAETVARNKGDGEAKLKEELRKSQEQVKKLKAQVAKKVEQEEGEDDGEEINEEITRTRRQITYLEDIVATDDDAGDLLDKKKARLEELLGVKRSSKPVDNQIKDVEQALERKKKNLQKQQEQEKELRESAAKTLEEADKAAAEQVRIKGLIDGLEKERNELYRRKVPGSKVQPTSETAEQARSSLAKLVEALGPKNAELDEHAKNALEELQKAVGKLKEEEEGDVVDPDGDATVGDQQAEAGTAEAAGSTPGPESRQQKPAVQPGGGRRRPLSDQEFSTFLSKVGFDGSLEEGKALLQGKKFCSGAGTLETT